MNDVLNFKSITTYRVALPLKFEFKTAKGAVRLRESIIIRIEDQQVHCVSQSGLNLLTS